MKWVDIFSNIILVLSLILATFYRRLRSNNGQWKEIWKQKTKPIKLYFCIRTFQIEKLKNWNEKKINASKSKLNVAINSNVANDRQWEEIWKSKMRRTHGHICPLKNTTTHPTNNDHISSFESNNKWCVSAHIHMTNLFRRNPFF